MTPMPPPRHGRIPFNAPGSAATGVSSGYKLSRKRKHVVEGATNSDATESDISKKGKQS